MPVHRKSFALVAALVMLLRFAWPAVAATWTTEAVPAGPGALGPARLSSTPRVFDLACEVGDRAARAAALGMVGIARLARTVQDGQHAFELVSPQLEP